MPSLEQIYEKLDVLERKISEVRDGFSLLDDVVADYFNINTQPGGEIVNQNIDELNNVAIADGQATMIDITALEGHLKTSLFNFSVTKPQTVLLRPIGEDVRAEFLLTASTTEQNVIEQQLLFETNTFTDNVEVIDFNGQRDYGAKFVVSETTYLPYEMRWEFAEGGWGDLWTLEKSNILWEIINIALPAEEPNYVLQCKATEPLQIFTAPQYALNRFGIALWGDIKVGEVEKIKANLKATEGQWIRMGLALRMQDMLNGYFALLESEIAGSFVRLYKVCNGMVTKIAENIFAGDFVLNHSYEITASLLESQIQVFINDELALDYSLEPLDIVSVGGSCGIVTMATSTVQCSWVETLGSARNVISPLEGSVTTVPFTVDNVGSWLTLEVDSSILQGRLEIDYSVDGGTTFIPLPLATIEYPSPITKIFDMTSVPITLGSTLMFRARLYEIGMTGTLRELKLKYLTIPESPFVLDNVVVNDNRFELASGALQGSVTTKSFSPKQIYSWDKIVSDHFQDTILDPITNLNDLCSVTVDSFQDPYVSDYIFDNSLDTYWESKRGADSWVMFEFPQVVEIHRFRWVKKTATDGATFYNFQVFDETAGLFVPVQTFGYEVNHDITHELDQPIRGKKFRLYINCVQPMSFGNARLIEIFGKSVISSSNIYYQYSLDDGITFNDVAHDFSLANLPISQPVKFRINFFRTNPSALLYVKKVGFRFVGRDPEAIQITDLQYDIWLGDKFIYNVSPFIPTDIRCVMGSSLQLKVRFLINNQYLFSGLKPWLSGYRIGISSSHYQEQLDALQAHINSVLWRADRSPDKDMLIDAIMGLIAQEAENISSNETDVDQIILRLMSYLNTEISKNRSRIVMGDVGHLDESLPSELFDADILL